MSIQPVVQLPQWHQSRGHGAVFLESHQLIQLAVLALQGTWGDVLSESLESCAVHSTSSVSYSMASVTGHEGVHVKFLEPLVHSTVQSCSYWHQARDMG
ncbi:hypothetical protein AVEN_174396-1 [Araneus ventricosus]|uniref:Uncharacterized protein n=1 Tax=Araneus ventricosus TaxID=182803 RepID=A0A4Y2V9N4_ARAVE|nr:hypothetical protein AVEN_174396-1 [Araneus ventricosus]